MGYDDENYPDVSVAFIHGLIKDNLSIEHTIEIGKTTAYLLKGSKAVHKRVIYVRESSLNEVTYNFAVAIAYKCGALDKLLFWLEQNKGWKDGGYTESLLNDSID